MVSFVGLSKYQPLRVLKQAWKAGILVDKNISQISKLHRGDILYVFRPFQVLRCKVLQQFLQYTFYEH